MVAHRKNLKGIEVADAERAGGQSITRAPPQHPASLEYCAHECALELFVLERPKMSEIHVDSRLIAVNKAGTGEVC